jgi:hypothetical protein
MYFAGINPKSGKLADLLMTPIRIGNFRVGRAPVSDAV